MILLLEALSARANCVDNRAIDAGVTDWRRQRVVLCLESLGHGGAKEGEQEIVQDRFEEDQGVRRIIPVPQAQSRRQRIRRPTVPVCGQEQGRSVCEGEVGQERKRSAIPRFGEDAEEREREDENANGARLGARFAGNGGESRQIDGCEIASS